jgi:hypothetical protein
MHSSAALPLGCWHAVAEALAWHDKTYAIECSRLIFCATLIASFHFCISQYWWHTT